jgi:AcrR family transcriptional regulator
MSINHLGERMSTDNIVTVDTSPAPARQRSPRGEGDTLRADLLDATAELIAKHGEMEAVSLRAVARRAGVSATAVYRHFDDHVELLRAAVDHCWATFYDQLRTAAVSSNDPFDSFRSMGDAYVAYAMERPGQYRVLFSDKVDLGDGDSPGGLAAFQLLVDAVAHILDELDDPRDPFFVAVQVHTWIHGIVDLCGSHPDMPWPDTARLLDGLSESLRLQRPPT